MRDSMKIKLRLGYFTATSVMFCNPECPTWVLTVFAGPGLLFGRTLGLFVLSLLTKSQGVLALIIAFFGVGLYLNSVIYVNGMLFLYDYWHLGKSSNCMKEDNLNHQ
ncbi:unnamed protein product [Tuwongella immobilis]|uniref:Transmembrane protein n=1 Tax=Tuwongella immobilis TaxID=692036 RepID=A0A6C2YWM0_9BACT|nr:unnamed protein product [Tuwongella immobilis]VTS07826.1 unnamed protein product [Tuwongella immobilis]